MTSVEDLCIQIEEPGASPSAPDTPAVVWHGQQTQAVVYDAEEDDGKGEVYPPSAETSPSANNDLLEHVPGGEKDPMAAEENPSVSAADMKTVSEYVHELSERAMERLNEGTDGLKPFEIENPFADEKKCVVLYSTEGPLNAQHLSALVQIAADVNRPEWRVLSVLFETLMIQRDMLLRLEHTAVKVNDGALHSAVEKFGEVERRRSYAMHALIGELDDERNRSYDTQVENRELRDRVDFAEARLDEIEDICREKNPAFSFENGVDVAMESVLRSSSSDANESPEEVVSKNQNMDELMEKILQLDEKLSKSRERSEDLLAENSLLQNRILELESSNDKQEGSPAISQRTVSPARDALVEERNELASICQEQKQEIELLKHYVATSGDQRTQANEALLSLNVEMEVARTKIGTLKKQRDTAEREWRDLEKMRLAERTQHQNMCKEMSENIVNAVNELNAFETKNHKLTNELADRETVIQDLQAVITEREEQLKTLTDNAVLKAKHSTSSSSNGENRTALVIETLVSNLRHDLERSQHLLVDKTNEITDLKKHLVGQEELARTLRIQFERYRAIAEVKTSSMSPQRRNSMRHYTEDQQNMFLQRLSEKLGVGATNTNDLVTKLISRVEDLMTQRSEFENSAVKLRSEVHDRERKLHVVRTEMQAEINTLKAEVQHLDNIKNRATEECKFAEDRVLELLGQKDLTKADSIGDLTMSSVGFRRQSDFSELGGFSRRESMISTIGPDHSIQWNDPLVAAAIESLTTLAEMKEKISARYRALREKLDRMVRRGGTEGAGVDGKVMMIESAEIQADLSGIFDMEQNIIQTLRPKLGSETSFDQDTLPYVQGPNGRIDLKAGNGTQSGFELGIFDGEMGEAAGFLRNQLKQTRELYNEKSRANAQLCGAVAALKQEVEYLVNEKKATDDFIAQMSDNHNSFLSRMSEVTGAEASMVAIEDQVMTSMHELSRLSEDVSVRTVHIEELTKKMMNIIAQKRMLSHMIYTYQSKYQLDMLMPSNEEKTSAIRRFRVKAFAVIAAIKLQKLVSPEKKPFVIEELDITTAYDVPAFAPIASVRARGPSLLNASVAISAVPRLEEALIEREKQLESLKSALATLENAPLPPFPEDVRNSIHSSFTYNEDVLLRKRETDRRLRKVMKEMADLEVRYSKEREVRIAVEAKLARYSERLATAKKRLGKANSNAESKERTYKAAIKYLKQKADKAVELDNTIDENTDPWATPEQHKRVANAGKGTKDIGRNSHSLALLESELRRAQSELKGCKPQSTEYEAKIKFIDGLHLAMQRLKKSAVRKAPAHGPTLVDENVIPQ